MHPLINERPKIEDRIVRPIVRFLVNSSIGKKAVERLPLAWLFNRPLADYDFATRLFKQYDLGSLEGDVLELGCWLGFGTRMLAALARTYGKKVHVGDSFPTNFGRPDEISAVSARRYLKIYPGMTQREVFDLHTRGFSNIVVHDGDIMTLTFPESQRFVCSFIDADHEDREIRHYLKLTWFHTTSGGLIFVNDYGNPETPEITQATVDLIADKQQEIRAVHVNRSRRIVAISKCLVGEASKP